MRDSLHKGVLIDREGRDINTRISESCEFNGDPMKCNQKA